MVTAPKAVLPHTFNSKHLTPPAPPPPLAPLHPTEPPPPPPPPTINVLTILVPGCVVTALGALDVLTVTVSFVRLNNSNEIPEIKPQIQSQKQFSLQKNKSVIKNQLLSEYLSFISYEINKMASKSYPIQSIKRREQGTIVSVLTINKDGQLINIEIKNKAPIRLYKATKKILNSFKFPIPPAEIMNNQGFLRIKIPVNYILK